MTDKRKDEMPDDVWCWKVLPTEHRVWGTSLPHENERYRIKDETKYRRADLSLPVPDDVAACTHNPHNKNALGFCIDCQREMPLEEFIKQTGEEVYKCGLNNFDAKQLYEENKVLKARNRHLEELRAASTPSAEVRAAFELGYTAGCQDTLEGNLSGLRHDEYLKALNQPHTGGK